MYDDIMMMMMMMMIYVNTQKKTNTYEDYGIPLSQKTEKKERKRERKDEIQKKKKLHI